MSWWLKRLSPAGAGGRLSIFIFHRVLERPDPLQPGEPDVQRFDALCAWVARHQTVLPLADAVERLYAGTLPAAAAAITFDDGYADNLHLALPILQRHRLPSTCFVASDFLDGGCMWNDRVTEALRATTLDQLPLREWGLLDHGEGSAAAASAPASCVLPLRTAAERRAALSDVLPRLKHLEPSARSAKVEQLVRRLGTQTPGHLMLRSADLPRLERGGMVVGAHTCSHPILRVVSSEQLQRELVDSRSRLQSLTQSPVDLFAYPNGRPDDDYGARERDAVQAAGFRLAVSTAWGAASTDSDRFQLPRFTPWDHRLWRWGWRLAGNLRRVERRCTPSLPPASAWRSSCPST